jgi:hypothetical protein
MLEAEKVEIKDAPFAEDSTAVLWEVVGDVPGGVI